MNQKTLDKVLTEPYWPQTLKTGEEYITTHDDHEGEPMSGTLHVQFSIDGDAWIRICGKDRPSPALRFRMPGIGGGKFKRVRNALLLLAEAIRQEGENPYA